MNNILVVNVNWLGDAVFSIPVFRNLKKNYPRARLSCLCVPRVKEVLEYCPFVDRIIVYDERGRHRLPWSKWALIMELKKEKFDAAFLLHRSASRALMVCLAGIPRRIGYCKTPALLTHSMVMEPEGLHRCDYYLRILEGYGLRVQERICELQIKPQELQALEAKLQAAGVAEADKYVVLNTGGNWDLKRWDAGAFGLLAKRLGADGFKVVFSGGGGDRERCRTIAQAAGINAVLLAGETTLGESLALYKKAAAVISGDSGPLHLAHSVGADVVGIFGPTRPEITGPRGRGGSQVIFKDVGCNKAPCYHLACVNNVCMQSVTVDDVYQAFKKTGH